jgi:LysR family glycine cleavage system transcriptional activator
MDKRLRWLNNLLCFEVAARHQSYSKAAEELFVSQAAVSQQMRTLEGNIGAALFRRQGRKMILTAQGKTLLYACQSGFSEIISGLNKVQEEPVQGSLTVSSTQAYCALWLLPNIYDFFNIHPEININVQASNKCEDLHEGNVDIAIRFSTSTSALRADGLVVEKIGENGVVPVCAPAFAEGRPLTCIKDLVNARLLALPLSDRVNWETYFEHARVDTSQKPLNKTEVSSSDLALSAALSGQGVMLASDMMIGQYIKSGQLIVPVDTPHPVRWKSHIVYLEHSPKQKRIELFCNWLKRKMSLYETL